MFRIEDRTITSIEPTVYLPVTASETYQLGEALVMGKTAKKCGASEKPTHICVGEANAAAVPAMPVLETTRFAVPYSAKPTVGDTVTLGTDALTVTATTGGVFTVVSVEETEKTATGYFKG